VVELDVYGDDLWMCFRECDWSGFGPCGSWFKAKMKLALIPKLMYLSRWCARQGNGEIKSPKTKAKQEQR